VLDGATVALGAAGVALLLGAGAGVSGALGAAAGAGVGCAAEGAAGAGLTGAGLCANAPSGPKSTAQSAAPQHASFERVIAGRLSTPPRLAVNPSARREDFDEARPERLASIVGFPCSVRG
jgi:hypothetical protein